MTPCRNFIPIDLEKRQWFKNLMNNEEYRELIIQDNDVRKTIGNFNSDRLDKKFFKSKYQRKLQNIFKKDKPVSLNYSGIGPDCLIVVL